MSEASVFLIGHESAPLYCADAVTGAASRTAARIGRPSYLRSPSFTDGLACIDSTRELARECGGCSWFASLQVWWHLVAAAPAYREIAEPTSDFRNLRMSRFILCPAECRNGRSRGFRPFWSKSHNTL